MATHSAPEEPGAAPGTDEEPLDRVEREQRHRYGEPLETLRERSAEAVG